MSKGIKGKTLGRKVSLETRLKQSKALKGKKHTEATKEILKIKHTGKKMSDEAKNKMKLAKLGHKQSKETIAKRMLNVGKIILQYDKNGNFIKEWEHARKIQNTLGYNEGHISSCCNGKRKSANGYIWKHKIKNLN